MHALGKSLLGVVALAALASLPAEIPAQPRGDRHVDEAVRYYGFHPARLRADQRLALDEVRGELFPEARRRPLNPAQATALVYMALVHPYERGRGGGYPPVPPRRDDCSRAERLVYDLEIVVNGGSSLFLSDDEKRRVRSLALEVQRGAADCRNHRAADLAGDVLGSVSPSLPQRSTVARHVRELKGALRDSGYGRR
jgi:hypothetical protein